MDWYVTYLVVSNLLCYIYHIRCSWSCFTFLRESLLWNNLCYSGLVIFLFFFQDYLSGKDLQATKLGNLAFASLLVHSVISTIIVVIDGLLFPTTSYILQVIQKYFYATANWSTRWSCFGHFCAVLAYMHLTRSFVYCTFIWWYNRKFTFLINLPIIDFSNYILGTTALTFMLRSHYKRKNRTSIFFKFLYKYLT